MEDIIEIGAYKIYKTGNYIQINYRKTIKDWFDIIFYSVVGLGILYLLYLVNSKSSTPFWIINELNFSSLFKYILILLMIIAFVLCAVYFLTNAIGLLFEPTTGLVKIDKTKETITIKLPFYKSITFNLSEIKEFNLYNDSKVVELDGINKLTSQCNLFINLMNANKKHLHTFRSNKLISSGYSSDIDDIITLKKLSQRISKIIASECGCFCRWNNYKTK
jgi:hypothetical protein